jgi:HipA-like protein
MPLAVEEIRRMRGGAQAHLMRCADDNYYVVKFQNNPQGRRILANELLASRIAARMGLPVAGADTVEVRRGLIERTGDLVIQLGRGREPCAAGLQFGSRFPGDPASTVVYDFLPDEQLREAANLEAFAGVLAFDKWTCNTNGRQAVFYHSPLPGQQSATHAESGDTPRAAINEARYRALFIDHGFCFNAGEWNFPDAPLRGIYARGMVYEGVRGMEAFEPWIARLEKLGMAELGEAADGIPDEWYDGDFDALEKMLAQLERRRKLVPELIRAAWKSSRTPFPNWS